MGRLERSGAVLNLSGTVLLRPGEVAEALALASGQILLIRCVCWDVTALLLD